MDQFAKYFDVLKLPPMYLAAIALICAAILFAPLTWLALLSVEDLSIQYRTVFGIGFLVSCALLVTHILFGISAKIVMAHSIWSDRRHVIQALRDLTPHEQRILQDYVDNNSRTLSFDLSDGVAQGLVRKGIIYQASNMGYLLDGFDYNLKDWILDYLKKNPKLLKDADKIQGRRGIGLGGRLWR